MVLSGWLLLHVFVFVNVLEYFVIVLFQSGISAWLLLHVHVLVDVLHYTYFVSAWLLLHVYLWVDVLDFVIVLHQSGVFEYTLFCVLMVVFTRRACVFRFMFWTSL